MIKEGIINSQLLKLLGDCGHTDWLMLSDAGMPIPIDKDKIDLAIINDLPRQLTVLKAIATQLQLETIFIAEEIKDISPKYLQKVEKLVNEFNIPLVFVPHEQLKEKSNAKQTRACIRTGERTSYSTMILQVGVPYGGDDETAFEI